MSRTFGAGIIGCGSISLTYLRLAPLFRGIEIRSAADIDMNAAKARAGEFGLKAQTVKEMLKSGDIDIVVNLTVPGAHYKVSKAALEAGKHIYSEKPLTLSLAEGKDLARIAKKYGLKAACAPDTFLGGAHQQARQAIDDGLVGKIVAGTAHIMGRGMENWHPNPGFFFKPGGGPVLDMGPYYITNLINLVGPLKRVAAMSATPRKFRLIGSEPRKGERIPVKTPTTLHALLEFANGAKITLSASWDVHAHRHQPMELYGLEGAIFVPDPNFFGGEVVVARDGADAKPLPLSDHPFAVPNQDHGDQKWANYRSAGLADLAQAIVQGRDARCSIERALHALEVMTAILESAESGKFVDLKTTCTRPRALPPAEAQALMK
jgi:predicted dehydrogenase